MRYRVFVSSHALRQWRKRVNPRESVEQIIRVVRGRLTSQMRVGLKVNSRGAFELELRPGITAIMGLDGRGWVVITVIHSAQEKHRLPG